VFQSFTTKVESTLDCITCSSRILEDEAAKKLRAFAQIVDREVWAIGKVSNLFKIPFYSYKLISDIAGNKTDCFDLKLRALEFSEQLLEYYLKLDLNAHKTEAPKSLDLPFHASFTQRKNIEKLSNKINDKSLIKEVTCSPDVKTANELIEELENIVNPVNKQIKIKVDKLTSPLRSIGAHIIYDKNLDQKKIKLQMEINSQSNIENLKEKLDSFHFSEFEKLWNGEIDV